MASRAMVGPVSSRVAVGWLTRGDRPGPPAATRGRRDGPRFAEDLTRFSLGRSTADRRVGPAPRGRVAAAGRAAGGDRARRELGEVDVFTQEKTEIGKIWHYLCEFLGNHISPWD